MNLFQNVAFEFHYRRYMSEMQKRSLWIVKVPKPEEEDPSAADNAAGLG